MRSILSVCAIVALCSSAHAQGVTVDVGGDGSDGALVLAADETLELQLPDDGVFNYTSISLGKRATLKFKRNARNTPVWLLSQGNVFVDVNAVIDVSGKNGTNNDLTAAGLGTSGPGGFDGGSWAGQTLQGSAGRGPGGGDIGGTGTYNYGNQLLLPLVGGSGGGGTYAGSIGTGCTGGGGGGAILIASNTSIEILGRVRSEGGTGGSWCGHGSGGAVRLVSPTVKGNGQIQVASYGQGRVRIDAIYKELMNLTFPGIDTGSRLTFDSLMVVFVTPEPRIDITQVGAQAVPLDHEGEYFVFFPTGTSPTQKVRVQTTGLTGIINMTLKIAPENGSQTLQTISIDTESHHPGTDGAGNPTAWREYDVTFPINKRTSIEVWTN